MPAVLDDLAVLTLTRDRTAHLRELVAGLHRGTMRPGVLVVARMGGEPVGPALRGCEIPVRVVELGADELPLAAARNAAVAAAPDAGRLVLLDVDCIPAPDLVATYARELDDGRPSLLMGDVRYLREGWTALEADSAFHPARGPVSGREPIAPELMWSLSFALTRSTWDRIGGFDEGFTGYGAEDTDLGLRAVAAGVAVERIPGACAYHQWHATHDPPVQHLESIVRNARRFHAVWGRWPMEGWLGAFAERGLVRWSEDALELGEDRGGPPRAAAVDQR